MALAPLPPVAAIVPLIGVRTITARARHTLLSPLALLPFSVSRLEFICRNIVPGKHSANTVTRAPAPRPFTLEAAPVVVVLEFVPLLELPEPLVLGVAVAVAPLEFGVAVAVVPLGLVVGLALALLLELLELLEVVPLPPVFATNDVAPQPHMRVLPLRI